MFFKKKEVEVEVEVEVESKEVKSLKEEIAKLRKEAGDVYLEHNKEIKNLKEDQLVLMARKDAELDVKVSTATKSLTNEVASLKLENGNYKKETEILTIAFENLGFDVKDMKDILNKLVDGIVSKNTVQLVK